MLTQVTFEVAVRRILDHDTVQSLFTALTADTDQTNKLRVLQTTQSRQFAPKRRPTKDIHSSFSRCSVGLFISYSKFCLWALCGMVSLKFDLIT